MSQSAEPLLYALPSFAVGIVLLLLLAAALWAGRWTRTRAGPVAHAQDGFMPAPPVVSTILGLLTLLISFTFSMAIGGYDKRQDAVIDEAEAIHSADLAAQAVGPQADFFRPMLQRYVELRLAAATTRSGAKTRDLAARSIAIQNGLWKAALALRSSAPGDGTSKLVSATEKMIEVGMRRIALHRPVVPMRVIFGVILFTVIASFVVGYSYRGVTHRTSVALLFLLTLVIIIIIDVEQPSAGAIRESQQPMKDIRMRLLSG